MSIATEISCAIPTTASGSVELVALDESDDEDDDDDNKSNDNDNNNSDRQVSIRKGLLGSFYPPFDSMERRASNAYALCATLVTHGTNSSTMINVTSGGRSSITDNAPTTKKRYSIACGGNDGSIYLQPLEVQEDRVVQPPFAQVIRMLRPGHLSSTKCLVNPRPGLLVSMGIDSSMRIWNVDDRKNSLLYQFMGYKVWVGSLWTDGTRLISDGADNTVIAHDFAAGTTNEL
jgi:hypothetical protein